MVKDCGGNCGHFHRSPSLFPAHTRAHAHIGNCENKSESTRKAVGENSSGAAEQPWTSFGLLKLDGVQRSAGAHTHTHTHTHTQCGTVARLFTGPSNICMGLLLVWSGENLENLDLRAGTCLKRPPPPLLKIAVCFVPTPSVRPQRSTNHFVAARPCRPTLSRPPVTALENPFVFSLLPPQGIQIRERNRREGGGQFAFLKKTIRWLLTTSYTINGGRMTACEQSYILPLHDRFWDRKLLGE